MNYKQKLGYMALGAGILALGIIIGQWVTPDIEAQNNGVFNHIQCSGLTVVNHAGKRMIELISDADGNMIRLLDKAGTPQMALSISDEANTIMISNKRNRDIGIWLISEAEKDNQILLYDPDGGPSQQIALRSHVGERSIITLGRDREISLIVNEKGNGISMEGKAGEESILLFADQESSPYISIVDRAGKFAWSAP